MTILDFVFLNHLGIKKKYPLSLTPVSLCLNQNITNFLNTELEGQESF